MTDFETNPIGTAAELERIRALLHEARRHVECLHDADPQPDTAQWLEEAKEQSS